MTTNVQFNEQYDKMIIDLPQDQLMRMCSLNKGLADYYKNVFADDLKYYKIVRNSSPEKFDQLSDLDPGLKKYYDSRREMVAAMRLKKYKVDYTDPNNLIYADCHWYRTHSSAASMKLAVNGKINFEEVYDLFLDYYKSDEIDCSNKGITSIPELPNLKKLDCSDNELESLPYFKNLEELICHNNKFLKFPGISGTVRMGYYSPKYKYSYSFPPNDVDVQKYSKFPKLKLFNGKTNFVEQLCDAYGIVNNISSPLDDKLFIGSLVVAFTAVTGSTLSWIRSRL